MNPINKKLLLSMSIVLGSLYVNDIYAQQVAILDSGVDPSAGYNTSGGYNYFNNTNDTSDVSPREPTGHGTVSVGAISESFSGTIVPYIVTDGSFINQVQSRIARDNALSDILGKDQIRVVAISWGLSGVLGSSASLISDLSRANKVISIMAGNHSASQPSALPTASYNLSGVIIVGASNGEGEILSNSNRAGTTAEKFVVTIGQPTTGDTSVTGGSSWAAARIAGIAGAVFQQNPNLTAAEVVEVILQSAEDLGAEGTDAIYGRGFIRNASQVLNNVIGDVSVPTETNTGSGSGGSSGGAGAALVVGGVIAGAVYLLKKPSTKLERTLVLDSYGRGFEVDLNNHITVNDGILNFNSFFNALEQKTVYEDAYIPSLNTTISFSGAVKIDHRIDMIDYFAMEGDVMKESDEAEMSIALSTKFDSGVFVDSGYKINPSNYFGAKTEFENNASFGKSSFITGQAFSSALTGFSDQANSFDVGYQSKDKKLGVKMGLVSVDQQQKYGLDSLSTIVEGKYQLADNAGISIQFGQLEEKGSLLGGAANGLYGVETATTYALNLAANLKVSDKVSVVVNYGMGHTKVDSSKNSLLKNFDSLKTNWYSVGLVANNLLRKQDQIGLALSQPIKVRSGSVDYSVPKHYNSDGSIQFDSERIDLSKTGATETSVEAYYRTNLSSKVELGAFASYRQNPNHVADQGDDAMVMATLRFFR